LEGSFEPLPPAGGLGGRGPWVGASGLPGHLMIISDVYWMILDALLFLTTSPGKAGLPG
jgi:hypothetical protein